MVKSKINDNIVYHEYSHLEKEDFNYRTPLYNLKIMGITVIVGVGQLNYRYSKRYGVVYVPIYLFNQYDEFIKQIGVYEMTTNEVKMDDSGDVEINKLTPLLYGTFVNTTLLRQSLVSRENQPLLVLRIQNPMYLKIMKQKWLLMKLRSRWVLNLLMSIAIATVMQI